SSRSAASAWRRRSTASCFARLATSAATRSSTRPQSPSAPDRPRSSGRFVHEKIIRMKSITVAQLAEQKDVPLIDVREPDEFAARRIPGAVNIPMREVLERLDELPDGAFNVTCELGGRSSRVVQALEA